MEKSSPSEAPHKPFPARHSERILRALRRRQTVFQTRALLGGTEVEPGVFQCNDLEGSLEMVPSTGHFPYGWLRFYFELETDPACKPSVRLNYDCGNGFQAHCAFSAPAAKAACGHTSFIYHLPPGVFRLRLQLSLKKPAVFSLRSFVVQEISKQEALVSSVWKFARGKVVPLSEMRREGRELAHAFERAGYTGLLDRLVGRDATQTRSYEAWLRAYGTIDAGDRAAISSRITALSTTPLISVMVSISGGSEKHLDRAIASVSRQLYSHWELCLCSSGPVPSSLFKVIEAATARDPRVKVGHEAAGDFVCFLAAQDELAEHALYMVAEEINSYPHADVFYSDEDRINDSGHRSGPHFKPDWNYDLLLSHNYIGHLTVYRNLLLQGLRLSQTMGGALDAHATLLHVAEKVPEPKIRHIPHVLYHARIMPQAHNWRQLMTTQTEAVRAHLHQTGAGAELTASKSGGWRIRYPLPAVPEQVTLVIPTRDRVDLLMRCVQSIMRKTSYKFFDIIIVDNQSEEAATKRYLADLGHTHSKVKVIPYDAPFNYAALSNMAVKAATGTVIGLINNDLEVLHDDWLEEMVSHAVRPGVGAVGAKLYYPDRTLQHGGVIFGIAGLAGHAHKHLPPSAHGYFDRAEVVQNFSAVTAACMLVRRATYMEVGGLNENFPVAFNDLDFCLRLNQRGYRNVWTPYAELIHHESATRGPDIKGEKRERLLREIGKMRALWGASIEHDPAYNPNLTLEHEDFSLAFPPRAMLPWKKNQSNDLQAYEV